MFLYTFLMFSNINFLNPFKSFQWQPSYSMWTDGWTDSYHEPDILFSGFFEVPNVVQFVLHVKRLQATDLLSLDSKQQFLRMA